MENNNLMLDYDVYLSNTDFLLFDTEGSIFLSVYVGAGRNYILEIYLR